MKINEQDISLDANLWLAVKRDIELKIITGEYTAGTQIPTIVELAENYGIGRTTVQKILNDMDAEGIIIKKVGVGCFVKPFIKEKLFRNHEKFLVDEIKKVIDYGYLLGLSDETLRTMFIDIINKKTSSE